MEHLLRRVTGTLPVVPTVWDLHSVAFDSLLALCPEQSNSSAPCA